MELLGQKAVDFNFLRKFNTIFHSSCVKLPSDLSVHRLALNPLSHTSQGVLKVVYF